VLDIIIYITFSLNSPLPPLTTIGNYTSTEKNGSLNRRKAFVLSHFFPTSFLQSSFYYFFLFLFATTGKQGELCTIHTQKKATHVLSKSEEEKTRKTPITKKFLYLSSYYASSFIGNYDTSFIIDCTTPAHFTTYNIHVVFYPLTYRILFLLTCLFLDLLFGHPTFLSFATLCPTPPFLWFAQVHC